MKTQFVLLLVLLSFLSWTSGKRLKIASFNVRIFGVKTMADPKVVRVLKKIIRRYDLILIQEIRDNTNSSIFKLLDVVNKRLWKSRRYEMELSDRLGRTDSKEQYAYLFRKHRVKSQGSALYPDSEQGDAFEREPFLFFVELVGTTKLKKVLFIGVHVKPSAADKEIEKLVDVYEESRLTYGYEDAVIMGDLNADCSYWSNRDEKSSVLVTDGRFKFRIDKETDTTVSNSSCAYDRFITVGKATDASRNAGVFRFDEKYGLTLKESMKVSDHYPIEMDLY